MSGYANYPLGFRDEKAIERWIDTNRPDIDGLLSHELAQQLVAADDYNRDNAIRIQIGSIVFVIPSPATLPNPLQQ